ncbi:hypothetical protein SESBI_46667 [Sesbania bispinosa]|nr:hypothetical protein SESBI_46667 [Sesbania bispinosa]
MASNENINDTSLVEMDLEVFEIDEALLRELLEEQEGNKDDNDVHGNIEESNVNPNMMDDREQDQQHQNCNLEQDGCHSINDFEWLNMMDMMEPTNPINDVIMSWSSDENIVGMVDFGFANGECYSQTCDGLFSNEASYGCLWGDYDI